LRLKLYFLDVIEVMTQTQVTQLSGKVVALAVAEIGQFNAAETATKP